MAKQTALHAEHLVQNARMIDFGGWGLPLQYGSQLEEHHRVRFTLACLMKLAAFSMT